MEEHQEYLSRSSSGFGLCGRNRDCSARCEVDLPPEIAAEIEDGEEARRNPGDGDEEHSEATRETGEARCRMPVRNRHHLMSKLELDPQGDIHGLKCNGGFGWEQHDTVQAKPEDPDGPLVRASGDGTVNYQSLRWPKTWAKEGRCKVQLHEFPYAGHQTVVWDPRTLATLEVYLGLSSRLCPSALSPHTSPQDSPRGLTCRTAQESLRSDIPEGAGGTPALRGVLHDLRGSLAASQNVPAGSVLPTRGLRSPPGTGADP